MKTRLIVLLALMAITVPAYAEEPVYECRGNEPFWSLRIAGAEATREMPSQDENGGIATDHAWGVSKQGNGWALWRGIFHDWDDTVAVITDTPCSDGMSDNTYPRRVILSLPTGEVHQGCCDCAK